MEIRLGTLNVRPTHIVDSDYMSETRIGQNIIGVYNFKLAC